MTHFTLQRFSDDWAALGGAEDNARVESLYLALEAGYGEPWRHFHNTSHIASLLEQLESAAPQAEDLPSVRVAAWFHDVICTPGDSGNEQASADLWRGLASGYLAAGSVDRVADLILDTRHVVGPASADGALLADVDLAGLGASPTAFDRQSQLIAAEFPVAQSVQCEQVLQVFLKHLLDRPWVYNTPHFRHLYEDRARCNLRRFLTL